MNQEYVDQQNIDPNMYAGQQLGFQNADPFLADEVNFTHRIITDEVKHDVLSVLDSLYLKKRTLEKIKSYLITGTTYELVVNNFPTKLDEQKEKVGFRYVRLWIDCQLSAVEAKYNDATYILKLIEIHHRTKLPRSAKGFERGKQKETITSSRVSTMQSNDRTEPKTGISRFGGKWRFS